MAERDKSWETFYILLILNTLFSLCLYDEFEIYFQIRGILAVVFMRKYIIYALNPVLLLLTKEKSSCFLKVRHLLFIKLQ